MQLSTRGKYGVKAMYELSRHCGGDPVPLKTIAANQGLSENYLEQLVTPLRNAGLLRSVRGSKGGYSLARDPSKITVAQIIEALEGPIAPCDCVVSGDAAVHHCGDPGGCVARGVWAKLRDQVRELLDSITLEDLADAE